MNCFVVTGWSAMAKETYRNNMRILTIASGGSTSNGALLAAIASAEGLASRGHEVTVLTPKGSFVDSRVNRKRVSVLNGSLDRWPLTELRRIRDWSDAHDIDIVHTHSSRASAFGAMLRRFYGIPTVATAHANKIQLHWCCNDHVIAVSDATRWFHMSRNLVAPWKITTVLNAIDTERFKPISQSHRDQVRLELGTTPNAILLGIVGNVIPRKGHVDAVKALATLVERFPETRLVIVVRGSTEDVKEVQQVADDVGVRDALIWTGYREDIASVLGCLDVLLCPSLAEPFGLIAPETLACEVPVIATRVGGFLTTIQDGETGYLVRTRAPEELANAASQLLRNPELRRRFGIQGRQWVQANLSPGPHFDSVERILSDVAKTARRSNRRAPSKSAA
jgi:glycosyltransferase involved in cell wall biosynthesis